MRPGSPPELAGIKVKDMMMSIGSVSATTEGIESDLPIAEEFRRFKGRHMSVKIARRTCCAFDA